MSLIAIPLKDTGEVDLTKPISSLLSGGRSLTADDRASLAELQALRAKMVSSIKNKTFSEAALRDMENYFDQLGNLEAKVPFGRLKIYFKWLSCFDAGYWMSSNVPYTMTTNLLYEKACVLFNIAAMATQIGTKVESGAEEDMKKSVRMFQMAAGIFTAVSAPLPESTTEQKPTPDLSSECATALSSLCLAQAQEIVLRKAIGDGKKESVLAKIAEQAARMFSGTGQLLGVASVKSLVPRDWGTSCEGKHCLYSGLSQWFASRQCHEEKLVGEEIARLTISVDCLNRSKEKLSSTMQSELTEWQENASTALAAIKKDNDFIYNERVPDQDDLSLISGTTLVKAVPLPDRFLNDQTDIFARMPIFDPSAKKSECIIS